MKECFMTTVGPRAVGPYSTAVVDGDTVYMSGMIPIDPAVGKLIDGDVETQTHRALQNIRDVLEEMGLSMAHVLKTTVLLTDLAAFGAVNGVYAEYFAPNFPARSCYQVAALPLGASIEIEVIATKRI